MRSLSFSVWALAALEIFCLAGTVSAQQFSADLETINKGETTVGLEFHLYFANNKIRMERVEGGINTIVLVDRATNTTVALRPDRMWAVSRVNSNIPRFLSPIFIENPLDACPQWLKLESLSADPEKSTCSKIGPDHAFGRSVIKYKIETPNMPNAFHWVDPVLKVAIKSQAADGRVSFLDNIHEGPQPASLFEIPSGYHQP